METIEGLSKRIGRTEDLQGVVKTMKSLAAVKIRQFERAVEALQKYDRTVKMALRVVLRDRRAMAVRHGETTAEKQRVGALVFGSDQGMCGQLNEQVVGLALAHLRQRGVAPDKRFWGALGMRVAARLDAAGHALQRSAPMPAAVDAITDTVQDLLDAIGAWTDQGVGAVYLFHARPLGGASYRPVAVRLLPVDRTWLRELTEEPWPTRMLPLVTLPRGRLFSELVQHYLFSALFRATAESLASENASRLASMQGAERNIEERLVELRNDYHRQRQMSITTELLDILSGFEALQDDSARAEKN